MDWISHGLWSLTVVGKRKLWWLTIIFGPGPDLLYWVYILVETFILRGSSGGRLNRDFLVPGMSVLTLHWFAFEIFGQLQTLRGEQFKTKPFEFCKERREGQF